MAIGESVASTGADTALVEVRTLSGSTAIPLISRAGMVGQPVFQVTSDDGTAYTPPTDTTIHGRVSTSDATTTSLLRLTVPDATLITVRARIRARSTGHNGALYVIEGAFKRNGGSLTPVGSAVVKTVEKEDVSSWNADLVVYSSSQVEVNVTGAAATAITWHGTIEASFLDN